MFKRISGALAALLFATGAFAQVGVQNPTAGGNYVPSTNILGSTYGLANAAGMIGEEIESSIAAGSAVALTTATPANVTSVALTPGNWLCNAEIDTAPAGGTTTSAVLAGISTTSATLATAPNDGNGVSATWALAAGVAYQGPVGTRIYRLSANTTVYLVANVSFAVSTLGAYGYLGCTRIP